MNDGGAIFQEDAVLRRQIATNLRELRRVRHLSQAELARRIGMRPGPLNAIEQGRHVPTGRVLIRLADALGTSVDALLGRAASPPLADAPASRCARESEDPVAYVVATPPTRKPAAVRIALADDPPLDPATAKLADRLLRAFLALEDLCGAQKRAHIPLFIPCVRTDGGMEALAQQVRQMLGVSGAVVFDYLELLENAGLRVVFAPLSDPHQSLAFYDPENANVFMLIRAPLNVERQLFELLKRLGSIYLHTAGLYAPPPAGGTLDDLRAARKFAALFLMPAQAVRASVAQLGIGPDAWTYELALRLKHRFGVSAQSFVFRLKELNLITPPLAARIQKRIETHYRRTAYGEPDSTRRILSPNGRLGDLLLAARGKPSARRETKTIERDLRAYGVKWADSSVSRERRAASPADTGKVHLSHGTQA